MSTSVSDIKYIFSKLILEELKEAQAEKESDSATRPEVQTKRSSMLNARMNLSPTEFESFLRGYKHAFPNSTMRSEFLDGTGTTVVGFASKSDVHWRYVKENGTLYYDSISLKQGKFPHVREIGQYITLGNNVPVSK